LLAAGIALHKSNKELTDQFPKSPEIVVHTICRTLENSLQDLSNKAEGQLQKEKEAFVTAIEAATQEYRTLEAQCSQIQIERDHQYDKAKALEHQLSESKRSIQQLEEERALLNEKYLNALKAKDDIQQSLNQCQQQLSEQSEQKKYEQAQLKQIWQEEREALLRQHDKAMDQVMVKWGNEKADWVKDKKIVSKNVADLSSQLNETKKENSHLVQKSIEQQHAIRSMEKSLSQTQISLKEQIEKLVTVESKSEIEISKLQAALQQKEDQLNKLLTGLGTKQKQATI